MFAHVADLRQDSARIPLGRIDALVCAKLGQPVFAVMPSRQRSIGKLPCTYHIESEVGAPRGSAGSTTAEITRQSAMRPSESKRFATPTLRLRISYFL